MASREAKDASLSMQQPTTAATGGTATPALVESHSTSQLDQVVIPTLATLQEHIQTEVDQRVTKLVDLNESGISKSQRGGNEIVWVKSQVPWPQNFVLGGSNKGRLSYDALNPCQWVAGFAKFAKSEAKPIMACCFYQRGLYHNQRDHETGGTFYKHVLCNLLQYGEGE